LLGSAAAEQTSYDRWHASCCGTFVVRKIVLVVVLLAAAGCDNSGAKRAWLLGQGGESDVRRQRAALVGARVRDWGVTAPVTYHVLASDDVRAYSWPDGSIYLTRGLMDLLSDDELAATIAHELAHQSKRNGAFAMVGLQGCDKDLGIELRADALGVQILEANGIPRAAMAAMLQKVHDSAHIPNACRIGMEKRITVLTASPH
jgi:Zn-dependent protease with chaperone function